MAGPCNARRHRPRRCVPPPPPTYPPLIHPQASGTPSTRSPTTRTSSRAPSPPSSPPPAASASSPSSKRGSPSYGASYVPSRLSPFFLLFPPSHRLSLVFPPPPHTAPYSISISIHSLFLCLFPFPPEAAACPQTRTRRSQAPIYTPRAHRCAHYCTLARTLTYAGDS